MAGQSAKKRLEENRKRLNLLRILVLVGLVCQVLILVLAVRKGTWTWSTVGGLLFTTATAGACYLTISKIAAPVYDAQGELIDGGGDLNRGGINGYAHDILYVTTFVQATTLLSSWFWLAWLVVPAFGLYKFTEYIIIPWIKSANDDGGSGPAVDDATRKKMQRSEERAQRRRMKWK